MAVVAGTHYLLGAAGVITPPYEPPVQIVSGASVVDHMGISRFSTEPRFAGWGGSVGGDLPLLDSPRCSFGHVPAKRADDGVPF